MEETTTEILGVVKTGRASATITTATLITQGDAGTTEKPEQFEITTQAEADWAVSLLADLEDKEARITAQYQKMLAQLQTDKNAWHGRFAGELENFARLELERTKSKRKSLTLFNGTLAFRTSPPRLVVESEADALQTARLVCPGAIVEVPASEKLDKKVLGEYAKRQLAEAGEIIPGYGLTEAREVFDVKLVSAGKGTEPTETE